MTLTEIKQKIRVDPEYDFLSSNIHLGKNIILLGLGGSYAYGTNNETSDLDIRGIALNSKEDILTNNNFEQFVNETTDTTIYSFNKMITLLSNSNPNTIEILGLKPEHYLFLSPIGKELLDNKQLFISKKCINSFGGYANQQLYRLQQKATHSMQQEELEKHILRSINFIQDDFKTKYSQVPTDGIKLYIDDAIQENMDTEIFMDISLTHYPLRDYASMWSEMQNIVKSYYKIGIRNKKALEHNKIAKHMMHLIRLNYMCLDLLEGRGIITYRDSDHDELMEIRNGKYVTEDNQIIPEFFDVVDELEKKLDYAKKHSELPEKPDYKQINEFVMDINERVVVGRL